MNADTLLENIEVLTEASNGVDHLKSIIFDLAVSGQLVERVASDVESPDLMQNDLKSSYLHSEIAGWFVVPLGKCAKIFNGNSTSSAEKLRLSHVAEGLPYVATKDVGYGFEPILLDTGLRVPVSKSQYKVAPDGAVLICLEGGSAGRKMGILTSQVCFGNKLFANVCRPWLDPRFLLICLLSNSFSTQFRSQLSGIIGGISKAKYSELSIPVPPLAEQKRIVAKVDELMTLCDQLEQQQKQRDNLRTATRKSAIDAISTATTPEELEAAWKRINNNWEVIADTPESVESLRTLILNLALRRQLTSTLGNATRRVDSFKELGSVLTLEYGKPLDKSLRTGNGSIPVYGANGVKAMTTQSLVKESGIVVGRKGSAGEVNMTEGPFWPLDVTFFAKFDRKIFDLKYLYYLLKSLNLPQMARGIKPGINRNDVNKLKVLSVDLAEQKQIVAKVDELMALCDQLESELVACSEVAEKFARSVVSAA